MCSHLLKEQEPAFTIKNKKSRLKVKLGHADINSTQIYAQITDCKISKDMDRLMERRNSRNEMPMDE